MKILVVCGAGASSTFVAHRVRKTAAERGLDIEVAAGSDAQLPAAFPGIDALLIGPHLSGLYEDLQEDPAAAGVALVLLPETIFSARDGNVALDLALDAVGARS
ncbi:PTS sugar transporter subunit IIB [Glaciibacter superstes]|uniref:PTS sugar transporter subunit IIB n=1 Tax=Glaciibacter superstes TaxID=501023 RepID=UPI0003B741B4|nr:PTS lactose transporter subunit IIB [Glaciibacter superstes]